MEIIEGVLWGVAGMIGAWVLYKIVTASVFVVQQGTVIVVNRWGKFHQIFGPGLHFRLLLSDKRHRTFNGQRQSLPLTLRGDSGGRTQVEVDAELEIQGVTDYATVRELAYRLADPLRHFGATATSAARQLLLSMSYEQIIAADMDFGDKLQEALEDVAADCGFAIISVRIISVRPEGVVRDEHVEGARAQHQRENERMQAEHNNRLLVEAATAAAEATGIEAAAERAQLDDLVRQINQLRSTLEGHLTGEQIAQLIAAMLYQLTATKVAGNSKAHIVLPPPTFHPFDAGTLTGLTPTASDQITARPA